MPGGSCSSSGTSKPSPAPYFWSLKQLAGLVLSFAPFFAFFLALLYLNSDLFYRSVVEDGDLALNALQIQRAKRFEELLGNYSRFGFHHPGPAFFYIFAAGEFVLRDLLHLVPSALNAHVIALMFVNAVFLWATIRIVHAHCPSPLLPPAGILAAIVFVATVNRTVTNGALVSIWMPYVPLFCFLLYATACASVAAGRRSHMPIGAAAGMLLIHAHVAQYLFVSVLGAAAVILCYRRTNRQVSAPKWPVYVSLVIVVLMGMPILVDAIINQPSNLSDIRRYVAAHPGFQNGPLLSVKYFASFLLFVREPETNLVKPLSQLFDDALGTPSIWLYWLGFGVLAGAAWVRRRRQRIGNRFVVFAAAEILGICGLFVFWAMKISGPLYNFNGFFIYVIQLYALLLLIALLLMSRTPGSGRTVLGASTLLYLAGMSLLWYEGRWFRNSYWGGSSELATAARSIPPGVKPVLVFAEANWVYAAGLANQVARAGKEFCVPPEWLYSYGRSAACQSLTDRERLVIAPAGASCGHPCSALAQSKDGAIQLRPPEVFRLPISIGLEDSGDRKDGFYGPDGGQRWSKKDATVRFALASDFDTALPYVVEIAASNLEGRPASVKVNGVAVGSFEHVWMGTVRLPVPASTLRASRENVISFHVPNAGPVGGDPRELGFSFRGLRIVEASAAVGRQ
jgi:hypothetical protein